MIKAQIKQKEPINPNIDQIVLDIADTCWKEVVYAETIIPGVYRMDCIQHGGYIVDIKQHPECKTSKNQRYEVFEEDEQYAIVEYLLFDKMFPQSPEQTDEEYAKYKKEKIENLADTLKCLEITLDELDKQRRQNLTSATTQN